MTEANEKPQPKIVTEIYEAACQLNPEEREQLYLLLVKDERLYAVDPAIEQAAIAECERRDALVREGKMELIDVDQVIREARRVLAESAE